MSGKDEEAGDYPLTLVAQIDPPSGDTSNLTASHVHVVDDYAYVSYNTVEDGYAGAIDIINIADPASPRLTSRLFYSNADINALKYDGGFVYAAGGVDSEKAASTEVNSFLAKIPVNGGRFDIEAGISYGFQEGYVGTDVAIVNNSVIVTSGKDGLVVIYDKTSLEVSNEASFEDIRSVAVNDNTYALLDAVYGVRILDQNLNVLRDISIDADFGTDTKKTLDFYGENVVVSEGPKGAGVYNYTSGAFVEYIPILISPDGVEEGDIVTNAVAFNDNVLLMANGGAGLCLSEKTEDNTDLVGIIALDGSINYVETKGDYVFAASGKAGLQIIKLNKPSESLVEQCASVQQYKGSSNLNVNQGEDKAYRGSKRFNSVNVGGNLLLCGSWTVRNAVNINSNASFQMNGTFVVGRNYSRKNINVNNGATFTVEGNLTIYGDLVLNDGSTLEFLGEDSVVNVFGSVIKNGEVVVKGEFRDVRNTF